MNAVVIQARTGSTRLPNKVLLPFYNGKSMLEIIIERIKIEVDAPVIVATSTKREDGAIHQLCNRMDVDCVRGSENDVLQRYIDTANYYKLDTMVRVCADNPFISTSLINRMIKEYNGEDYISYLVNDRPAILSKVGMYSEMVKVDALRTIDTTIPEYSEHVTSGIYTHPDKYKVRYIDSFTSYGLRLTVDTLHDFIMMGELYGHLHNR